MQPSVPTIAIGTMQSAASLLTVVNHLSSLYCEGTKDIEI